jgi:hypothetical protein
VVLIAIPDETQATGFVVSREHRLVVTAAHVADDFLTTDRARVYRGGAEFGYKVRNVWYHPRVERRLDIGLVARSPDPSDGPVRSKFDLAVMQLSKDGPELPAAVDLAAAGDRDAVEDTPVGILGFAGDWLPLPPTSASPADPRFCASVLHRDQVVFDDLGSELRADPFLDDANVHFDWHYGDSAGLSGSPIFESNGLLVAVAQHSLRLQDGREQVSAARIACLRELIAYHRLERTLSPTALPTPSVADWGPDPRIGQLRRAVALVREASQASSKQDYRSATLKCNQALALAPKYGNALIERCQAYLGYTWDRWPALSRRAKLRYVELAISDSHAAVDECGGANSAFLTYLQALVFKAYAVPDRTEAERAISVLTKMVTDWRNRPLNDEERAYAFSLRAQCHELLGHVARAASDYERSIEADRTDPRGYLDRAAFIKRLGQPNSAEGQRAFAGGFEQMLKDP